MFSIGEFSRMTSLSIKALRLYHEKELLLPSYIDEESGYRYYGKKEFEKAVIIGHLKKIGFSLSRIKEIVENYQDESEIIDYLEKRKEELQRQIHEYENISHTLDVIIQNEKESIMTLQKSGFSVEEKEVEDLLIASIRYRGKYEECGVFMGRIGKAMGRFISGKPFNLYYDNEFREGDADIEVCFPVRKGKEKEGINIKQLKGGKCLSLIHKGPYDELGRSYKKIYEYLNEKKMESLLPIRENYLKGPGMILKGNPENYLTEIQLMIKE
jgi:DNA-binding transcriptional MerR regulator